VKLTVARKAAHAAAASVARIVDREHASEPCRHARLSVVDGRLELSATDLRRTVWASVPCNSDGTGETLLPARELETALGITTAEDEITLAIADRAILSAGRRRLQLPIYPSEYYPQRWTPPPPDAWIPLPAGIVSTLVAWVKPAMHEDASRPIGGVLLERREGELSATATTGGWLGFAATEVEPGPEFAVVVPRGALIAEKKQLPFLLGHMAGEIEIAVEPSRLWIRGSGFSFATQLIEGNFPNWRPLLSTKYSTRAVADRKALLQAIRAVDALTEKSTTLALAITPGQIVLAKHSSEHGISRDEVACRIEGTPARTALHSDQPRLALEEFDSEEVTIEIGEPTAPVRISSSDPRHFYLLMPMSPSAIPTELSNEV
jgi:DNA polymerase-3 subunit beta